MLLTLLQKLLPLLEQRNKDMNKPARVHLYETALSFLGKDASPNDIAPDELGCAETVNAIYRRAFGIEIGGDVSTYRMYRALDVHPNFERVDSVAEGDIIISPTGYGNGRMKNGHVGVLGIDGKIMSNDSNTGKFVENFTVGRWNQHYGMKGGYPLAFFRVVGYPTV